MLVHVVDVSGSEGRDPKEDFNVINQELKKFLSLIHIYQAAEISQNIVTETNIENLVKYKGFVDCVAFIQNGACNVVVQKDGEFASADAIAIKDIVVAQAKISADKITIVSK